MAHPHDTLFDVDGALIAGAGLAGLFTALKLAPHPVTVLSPMALVRRKMQRESNSKPERRVGGRTF